MIQSYGQMKHFENEIEEPVDFIDGIGICLAGIESAFARNV